MENKKIILRPFPISTIKNNFIRRACIILFYIPIIVIGFLINIVRGVIFFLVATKVALVSLFNHGRKCWDKPETAKNED